MPFDCQRTCNARRARNASDNDYLPILEPVDLRELPGTHTFKSLDQDTPANERFIV